MQNPKMQQQEICNFFQTGKQLINKNPGPMNSIAVGRMLAELEAKFNDLLKLIAQDIFANDNTEINDIVNFFDISTKSLSNQQFLDLNQIARALLDLVCILNNKNFIAHKEQQGGQLRTKINAFKERLNNIFIGFDFTINDMNATTPASLKNLVSRVFARCYIGSAEFNNDLYQIKQPLQSQISEIKYLKKFIIMQGILGNLSKCEAMQEVDLKKSQEIIEHQKSLHKKFVETLADKDKESITATLKICDEIHAGSGNYIAYSMFLAIIKKLIKSEPGIIVKDVTLICDIIQKYSLYDENCEIHAFLAEYIFSKLSTIKFQQGDFDRIQGLLKTIKQILLCNNKIYDKLDNPLLLQNVKKYWQNMQKIANLLTKLLDDNMMRANNRTLDHIFRIIQHYSKLVLDPKEICDYEKAINTVSYNVANISKAVFAQKAAREIKPQLLTDLMSSKTHVRLHYALKEYLKIIANHGLSVFYPLMATKPAFCTELSMLREVAILGTLTPDNIFTAKIRTRDPRAQETVKHYLFEFNGPTHFYSAELGCSELNFATVARNIYFKSYGLESYDMNVADISEIEDLSNDTQEQKIKQLVAICQSIIDKALSNMLGYQLNTKKVLTFNEAESIYTAGFGKKISTSLKMGALSPQRTVSSGVTINGIPPDLISDPMDIAHEIETVKVPVAAIRPASVRLGPPPGMPTPAAEAAYNTEAPAAGAAYDTEAPVAGAAYNMAAPTAPAAPMAPMAPPAVAMGAMAQQQPRYFFMPLPSNVEYISIKFADSFGHIISQYHRGADVQYQTLANNFVQILITTAESTQVTYILNAQYGLSLKFAGLEPMISALEYFISPGRYQPNVIFAARNFSMQQQYGQPAPLLPMFAMAGAAPLPVRQETRRSHALPIEKPPVKSMDFQAT